MIPPANSLDLERDLDATYANEALHTPGSLLASVLRVAAHWKLRATLGPVERYSDEAMRIENRSLEELAAAFVQKTGLDPRRCELVRQTRADGIVWFFREHVETRDEKEAACMKAMRGDLDKVVDESKYQ